ncbi:hypothetical protein ILUMI_06599 [Ignelater luminosus]|uniref:Uncharacterized protein n=1 Tax=Ignelater luminosus TaxID=2038154 RepID=A0A8K0GH25_IGNLU|nr:hypothetical protein ILUMI_06599 [Ignelater luminosus]
MGDQVISRSTTARHLVLHLDKKRNFREHTEIVCSRASLEQRQHKLPLTHIRMYLDVVLAWIGGHVANASAHRNNENIKNRERVDPTQRGFLVTAGTLAVATKILPLHLEVERKEALYSLGRQDPDKALPIVSALAATTKGINVAILQKMADFVEQLQQRQCKKF